MLVLLSMFFYLIRIKLVRELFSWTLLHFNPFWETDAIPPLEILQSLHLPVTAMLPIPFALQVNDVAFTSAFMYPVPVVDNEILSALILPFMDPVPVVDNEASLAIILPFMFIEPVPDVINFKSLQLMLLIETFPVPLVCIDMLSFDVMLSRMIMFPVPLDFNFVTFGADTMSFVCC